MSATTRWKDLENSDLNCVLEKMTGTIPNDQRTASTYRINFRNRLMLENNGIILLNGEEIEYNVVKYNYVQVTAQEDQSEDREIVKQGFIVVTKSKGSIYYIIDQNTTAKRLLRKLLNYSGRNEIEDASFGFEEDFFVWLVSRVYNSDNLIVNGVADEEKELVLKEIKGIRGNTEDLQAKVATSGESVMNIISTLSFLLESRRLNQVLLNMKYTGHENIYVKIQKNTVDVSNPYLGEYTADTNEVLLGMIYLLLYFEILPLLEQEYRLNKEDEVWNQNAYIEFLRAIKDTVIEKIESKIALIS